MRSWIGIFLTVLAFSGFANAKVVAPTPEQPDPITQLTTNGYNRQPLFVADDEIVYVSRNRVEHKDPQIYKRNLITGKEKRITFQRGHIINGVWLSGNKKLVFASSTDEDKETPHLLKKYIKRYPASIDTEFFFHLNLKPTEIYSTKTDGTDINRLSYHPGFDAFPAYDDKKRVLYFSRLENGKINIYSQAFGSKVPAKMVMDTFGHDLGLQISPKKDKMTWYRFSPDFNSSQIMMANMGFKNQKLMTIDSGIQWTPQLAPHAGDHCF